MTTITGNNIRIYAALQIVGHLRLHAKGMRHSRLPLKGFLETAGKITGQSYKGKANIPQAITDLKAWADKEAGL